MSRSWMLQSLVVALASACAPSFDVDLAAVGDARVVAVRAEPAEAEPGEQVTLSALVATSDAEVVNVNFGLCVARKDLAELGPVAPECLRRRSSAVEDLGSGRSVQLTVPEEVCSMFGPRRPDPKPGEPAGRPADPDPTGGFYQPVIARLGEGEPTLGGVRLACGLHGADREHVEEYNRRFSPNLNPKPGSLSLRIGGKWVLVELAQSQSEVNGEADGGAATGHAGGDAGSDAGSDASGAVPSPSDPDLEVLEVNSGAEVGLRLAWEACPRRVPSEDAELPNCGGAEAYLAYDQEARSLQEQRERLVVSWYASAGQLAEHRTAPANANAVRSDNSWRAPSRPGPARLWVVVRDGRGGVGWGSVSLTVR